MSKNWYDSDNPSTFVRGGSWRAAIWIVLAVLFFTFLGWGLWGLGVISSPIKGAGDAFKQKESANNRISKQALFEDLNAEYESSLAKIPLAKKSANKDPNNQVKQTEYVGLVNYCVDVAGKYNAESEKYLAADFKRVDLPYTLDRNACNK